MGAGSSSETHYGDRDDHEVGHLPLRLCRAASSGVSRAIRRQPPARTAADSVGRLVAAVLRPAEAAEARIAVTRTRTPQSSTPSPPPGRRSPHLHVGYEQQPEYPAPAAARTPDEPLNWRVEKMRLAKDKAALAYNDFLTLAGIPQEAFDYRLGNRSALEWVIDQYQVSTDKRSGITNDPNRADDPRIHRAAHRPGHHRQPGDGQGGERVAGVGELKDGQSAKASKAKGRAGRQMARGAVAAWEKRKVEIDQLAKDRPGAVGMIGTDEFHESRHAIERVLAHHGSNMNGPAMGALITLLSRTGQYLEDIGETRPRRQSNARHWLWCNAERICLLLDEIARTKPEDLRSAAQ